MLYGLLLVAWGPRNFSETDCAVGSILFLQRFGPYFTSLVVLKQGILLRTLGVTQSEHLKPWVHLSFLGSGEEVSTKIFWAD